jgi:hypothetical protein
MFENQMSSTTTSSYKKTDTCKGEKLKPKRAKQLRDDLLEYRLQLAGDIKHKQLLTGLDLITGFTRTLIDSIVESARELTSVEMLLEKFSFFERKHAEHVWQCICDLSDSCSDDNDDEETDRASSEDSDIGLSFLRCRHSCLQDSSESE